MAQASPGGAATARITWLPGGRPRILLVLHRPECTSPGSAHSARSGCKMQGQGQVFVGFWVGAHTQMHARHAHAHTRCSHLVRTHGTHPHTHTPGTHFCQGCPSWEVARGAPAGMPACTCIGSLPLDALAPRWMACNMQSTQKHVHVSPGIPRRVSLIQLAPNQVNADLATGSMH